MLLNKSPMLQNVLEALASRAGNGGNVCSLSVFLCPCVRERFWETGLVWSLAHPLKDQKKQAALSLQPVPTTEKLVYVYPNSEMVLVTSDADELKIMSAWDNEDAQMQCDSKWPWCSRPCARVTVSQCQGEASVAQLPSRKSLILAESQNHESLLRDSARLGLPWLWPWQQIMIVQVLGHCLGANGIQVLARLPVGQAQLTRPWTQWTGQLALPF